MDAVHGFENRVIEAAFADHIRSVKEAAMAISIDSDVFGPGWEKDAAKTITHKGKTIPTKVKQYADEVRRKDPSASDEYAYRVAWDRYLSYKEPGYKGRGAAGGFERGPEKPLAKP